MQTTTNTRKYALVRVEKGDYLLPTNDGRVCLRFQTYEETGDAGWDEPDGTWHPVIGTFWCVRYKPMPTGGFVFTSDIEAWLRDGWYERCIGYRSRREAIEQMSHEISAGWEEFAHLVDD